MTRATFATLLAASIALASGPSLACPRQADPALRGAAVGQDVVVNGLPVQIQQVTARESAEALLGRTERAWIDAGYKVKRQAMPPWSVVSAISADCLTTLQLMDRGGAVGFLAIGEPGKAKAAARRSDIPLPGGAQVVSTVSSKDGARRGTTTTIASKGSVGDMRDQFLQGLSGAGWDAVRAHGLRSPGSLTEAQVVTAQRGGESVQIVIFEAHGSTTAVISAADAL